MRSSYTLARERAVTRAGREPYVAAQLIGVMFMGSTLLTPLYILYRRAFVFSEMTLTLIYAVYVIGNIGALFFFGRISDQIGRRRASLPAMAVGGVATLIFLFARDTAWLFVARMLSGLAIGVASGAATAWLAELVPSDDKPRASALATFANFIGLAIGPLIAGLLAQFAPAPLHTSFVVYLITLALVAWQVSTLDETVQRIKSFSDYLGNEIALAVTLHGDEKAAVPLVMAEITKPGLAQFLTDQLAVLHVEHQPVLADEGQDVAALRLEGKGVLHAPQVVIIDRLGGRVAQARDDDRVHRADVALVELAERRRVAGQRLGDQGGVVELSLAGPRHVGPSVLSA